MKNSFYNLAVGDIGSEVVQASDEQVGVTQCPPPTSLCFCNENEITHNSSRNTCRGGDTRT
eukprot:12925711-Prorocentrum_lima.AAC.1